MKKAYSIQKGVKPFTHVTTDLFYMPQSDEGYRYVVVGVDSFTKWPEDLALKERNSRVIARWLHRDIVCRYGAPAVVRTDNGREFFGEFHDYLV